MQDPQPKAMRWSTHLPAHAAPTCTKDACLGTFELFSIVTKPLCSVYTRVPTPTVPAFAAQWVKVPAKISSACTCLGGVRSAMVKTTAPATTAVPTSSIAHLSILRNKSTQASSISTTVPVNVCYVTAYTTNPAAIAACTFITLDGITVPGNSTIDLLKLKTGTKVVFRQTSF